MQTSNYQCGHCGKPIVVGEDPLGREVRCPHCQQVVPVQASRPADPVVTPTEAVVATPEPPVPPPPEHPDVSPRADDRPAADVVADVESFPPILTLAADHGAVDPSTPAAETVPELPSGVRIAAADPVTVPAGEAPDFPVPEQPIAATRLPDEPAYESPAVPDVSEPVAALSRERRPARARSGVSIWYVLPLVSYSVLATCLLVVLWNRLQTTEDHPLVAFLPDAEGDAPGVVRKLKSVSESRKRKLIGQPLPEELKLRLGETRTIGSLAVTPQRVARERVGVAVGATRPEELNAPALVLHLRLENVSEDESFQPLDRYFDRKWREGTSPGAPPLTLLEAGPGRRFFGGPAAWRPRRSSPRNNDAAPEFIYLMTGDKPVGNPVDRPLGPGESEEVFVCTDGDDPRSDEISRYRGEFLWHVHLRRGLVRVRGRDGREREVPAAAVVGVVFNDKDVGG